MIETRMIALTASLVGGLLGLAISLLAYLRLNPSLDPMVLLVPPALAVIPIVYDVTRRVGVDLTPLATTPLAYTLYHITSYYLREPGDIQTLLFSLTLGSSITLLILTPTLLLTLTTVSRPRFS